MAPMPKETLSQPDYDLLVMALDLAIASARRASNTSKKPMFKELYDKEVNDLLRIRTKLTAS